MILPEMRGTVGAPDSAEPLGSVEPRSRPGTRAVEVTVTGVVQGVGFRPFVHRVAREHGLSGWVRNESGAVRMTLEGSPRAVDDMLRALRSGAPPLARLDSVDVTEIHPVGRSGFSVRPSETDTTGRLPVSPDVATCAACEAELFDPANRRYRYPFITCTDCGPRFTVIEAMPYDRERTSMSAFPQCAACFAEYGDAEDRRYHSETNSCPDCGPRVWLERPGDGALPGLEGDSAIVAAAEALRDGEVLALRGLGGFHLAVRADDEAAVSRLRERKHRYAKPLALMVRDLGAARALARVSDREAALLTSPERPIVVLERRKGAPIADAVSPGLSSVALMLPYTPLHFLLLDAVDGIPLVMTSGNVSQEPIATSNEQARIGLAAIADVLLLHDREIVARYDDSVVRVADAGPVVLRRSRGLAPMPLPVPTPVDDGILAMGPHLKNTFTLLQGRDAYVSPHIGDLQNLETVEAFQDALDRFRSLFRLTPSWVVRDLHVGYLSTRLAEESGLTELPAVQHHHAHVAAVMAEHGVTERVLGLAFDGTGYGADGNVWGCELLLCDLVEFERVGHLRYAPMPGGDRAARTPWRALLGYASLDGAPGMSPLGVSALPAWTSEAFREIDPLELAVARRQVARSLNAPLASSMGRLFDAAAALLGVRGRCRYEGQAAMELEALAGRARGRTLPFARDVEEDGCMVLDPVPLLHALADQRAGGRSLEACAADFHESVVEAATSMAQELCEKHGVSTIALGGGCFQNARLLDGVSRRLSDAGRTVLLPRLLSPNDGAVSYGQAVVTAARLSQ
jgi:hydrogenase maturation protein HypF